MQSIMLRYGLFIGVFFTISSCFKPDNFPVEPQITNVTINKSSIQNLIEGFTITVEFTDGDGDLGVTETIPEANAFFIDSRTAYVDSMLMPYISPQGTVNSIFGQIDFEFSSECCIAISGISCTPDAEYFPTDTVTYDIIIKDRAGNVSNTATSPPLIIMCPQ